MVERPQRIRTEQVEVFYPTRWRWLPAVGAGVSLGCLYVCLRALRYRRVR